MVLTRRRLFLVSLAALAMLTLVGRHLSSNDRLLSPKSSTASADMSPSATPNRPRSHRNGKYIDTVADTDPVLSLAAASADMSPSATPNRPLSHRNGKYIDIAADTDPVLPLDAASWPPSHVWPYVTASLPQGATTVDISMPPLPGANVSARMLQWGAGNIEDTPNVPRCKVPYSADAESHVAAVKRCAPRDWPPPLPPSPVDACDVGPHPGVQCYSFPTMSTVMASFYGCQRPQAVCVVDDLATLPAENIVMWEATGDVAVTTNPRPPSASATHMAAGVTARTIVRVPHGMTRGGGFVASPQYFLTKGYRLKAASPGTPVFHVAGPLHEFNSLPSMRFDRCLDLTFPMDTAFSHFSNGFVLRADLSTQFVMDNPEVQVLVCGTLAYDFLKRTWEPLGISMGRVHNILNTGYLSVYYAKEMYVPEFYGGPGSRWLQYGVAPRGALNTLGPLFRSPFRPHRDTVTLLTRKVGRMRSFTNQTQIALIDAVRTSLKPGMQLEVLEDPSGPYDTLADLFSRTAALISVHGGAMVWQRVWGGGGTRAHPAQGNLFLLHPGAHVIEISADEEPTLRVMFMGATYGGDSNHWLVRPTTYQPAAYLTPDLWFYSGDSIQVNPDDVVSVLQTIGVAL